MPRPPAIRAARPGPVCGGAPTLRRCPTAHRRMLICAGCGWRGPLPEALRLRLAGWKELDLFDEEEVHADRS